MHVKPIYNGQGNKTPATSNTTRRAILMQFNIISIRFFDKIAMPDPGMSRGKPNQGRTMGRMEQLQL